MANKGVIFGSIHSWNDLELILAPFVIPPAKPKINLLDIPAGDGSLDLTEALGEVKYEDREFAMKFTVDPNSDMTFDEKLTQVSNALNGRAFEIILDRDPDWFWQGRCIVDDNAQSKVLQEITIKAIVRPYKLKRNWTEYSFTIQESESSKTVSIENSRKTVVPYITIDRGTVLSFNFEGKAYQFDSLTQNRFPEIQLKEGANEFTFFKTVSSGAQRIEFNYREGAL